MRLLLEEAIKRAGDDTTFFRAAYMWRFGKDADVHGDVLAWRVQQAIPNYAKEYLKHVFGI